MLNLREFTYGSNAIVLDDFFLFRTETTFVDKLQKAVKPYCLEYHTEKIQVVSNRRNPAKI